MEKNSNTIKLLMPATRLIADFDFGLVGVTGGIYCSHEMTV